MPTSAGDIGEGLLRSASALAAAGNTLDESIALFTAGQGVVQNAESLGNILKTTSMRIRGAETELEEAGLDTDGMADSVSKLRSELMALTGGFDIMEDGGNTFKSTYDILKGISEVWNNLTDVSRANVLEKLAGKRNGNALAAILENFDIAEKTLDIAQNQSYNSALKENEVFLDSINGKISQISATWESLSNNTLDSSFVKGVLDFLNGALKVLDSIVKNVGVLPPLIGAVFTALAPMKTTGIFGSGGLFDIFSSDNLAKAKKDLKDYIKELKGVKGFTVGADGYELIHAYNTALKEGKVNPEWWQNFRADTNNRATLQKYKELDQLFTDLEKKGNKTAIGVNKAGNAFVAAASGVKGLGTWIKALAGQLVVAGIQFAIITAAIWALSKAWEWFKNSVPTKSNLRNWADESADALADTRSEIESLNSELDTTRDRINELQGKGYLTLTEQDELERLRKTNDELERQLLIKKALEETEAKKAAEDAARALHSYDKTFSNDTDEAARIAASSDGTLDVAEQLNRYASIYSYNKEQVAKVDINSADAEAKIAKFNAAADEAKEKFNQLTTDTAEYVATARDGWDLLSEDEQKYIKRIEDAIVSGYFDFGTVSADDALKSMVGSDEYDAFQKKLQELAATGGEVGDSLKKTFGQKVASALQLLGYNVADVNEQIKAMRNISDYIDNNATEEQKRKIQEMVNDPDFEITADSIRDQLGDGFIQSLEKAGFSVDSFRRYLVALQEQIDTMDISSATGDLKEVESNLSSLATAYNEFKDNSGKVSAATLDGLAQTFSSISDTESFTTFINVLGNSASSVSQVKAALDDLVDTYFATEAACGSLTAENSALYEAQLKQMGVTNASEVVQYKLAKATINNASATDAERQAAIELIEKLNAEEAQLYNTASASLTSAQNLQILQIQMQYVKSGDFTGTIANNASSIVALGKAAGKNGTILAKYAEILMQIAEIENKIKSGNGNEAYSGAALRSLKVYAAQLEEEAQNQYDSLYSGVRLDTDFKVPRTKSGSSSSGTTTADKNKEAYDAAKKKLDYQLEQNKISYDKYYKELVKLGDKYLKKEKGNLDDLRDHYTTLADVRRSAFEDAKGKLDTQLDNGTISIEKYYSKIEALIKKWYKGRKANAEDAAQAEIDLQKQVADAWKDRISKQETQFERMTLDKVWPEGKTELDYWQKQMAKLQKDYRKGMFKDKEAYMELYYDLLSKIQSAEKEFAQKQLDEVTKKISSIDDLVDMVSKMLKQRIEDEIDSLEKLKSAYSEIVDAKKESLQLTKDELAYQQEISEMNEDLTKLQAQAELLKLDTSRAGRAKYAEVMEQIREKQKDISDKQADHTYDATVDALDKADEQYQEFIQNRIDALNQKMENQGEWLRYVYSYIESTKPSQLLSELKAYNYKYGDGINQTVDKIWNAYAEYADTVYGKAGYLVQILEELRNLEIKYQAQVDAADSSSSNPSDNYRSNLSEAVMHKNLMKNTDEQNMQIRDQVEATYGGSWWWDPEHQQIYRNDTANKYLISAASYPLIEQMKKINNSSSLSKKERKKQLSAILSTLKKTYYGFTQAHLEAGKNGKYHLYKRSGKDSKWQIFHDGINAGYTGADYVPTTKQNELLALLKKGELVFNKDNQNHLLSQLQAIENFQRAFKGIAAGSISQTNYNSTPVSVGGVTIQIYGNATQDTVQALRREAENISNMTMNKLQSAMVQKGYASGAARSTFKR